MPLGGAIITAVVSIATAIVGTDQQKKIAKTQSFLANKAQVEGREGGIKQIEAQALSSRKTDLSNLMGGVASNYQQSQINKAKEIELEAQRQKFYYLTIGSVAVAIVSTTYIIFRKINS
jgi:hypothetical protein